MPWWCWLAELRLLTRSCSLLRSSLRSLRCSLHVWPGSGQKPKTKAGESPSANCCERRSGSTDRELPAPRGCELFLKPQGFCAPSKKIPLFTMPPPRQPVATAERRSAARSKLSMCGASAASLVPGREPDTLCLRLDGVVFARRRRNLRPVRNLLFPVALDRALELTHLFAERAADLGNGFGPNTRSTATSRRMSSAERSQDITAV
jgi:hypothetical protein